jgi:exo-1,4-beta-D-glucosaminidase
MTGPYEYVPPIYWYADKTRGGAFGFITETSPGPAVPPLESLKKFLPKDHLWPIDEFWDYHTGGGPFHDLKVFTQALGARYGEATSVEDYARKAQMMTYEGQRAMYESYGRNKYVSTGVLQEMLNQAWPSLIWQLYDYYLRPGGGYFGTKKACEPLHIQYSYDDRSVVIVNSYFKPFQQMKARAAVYDLDLKERFNKEVTADVGEDSSTRVFVIPEIDGLTPTYFVNLALLDSAGQTVSSNFYWLSTKPEVLDWEKSTWYYTPTKAFADFTALEKLPKVALKVASRISHHEEEDTMRVVVTNPTPHLALAVHLRITKGRGGEEVLPILWGDNYFALMPGEKREVGGTYHHDDLRGEPPVVEVDGWNVAAK